VAFESKITNMVAMQNIKVISDIYKYVYKYLYTQRYSLIIIIIITEM
jgi:hypothetical protein